MMIDDKGYPMFVLHIHKRPDDFWMIESPGMKGLLLAGKDLAEQLGHVPGVMSALWAAIQESKPQYPDRSTDQEKQYEPFCADPAWHYPVDGLAGESGEGWGG